jgi:hypothetical protein
MDIRHPVECVHYFVFESPNGPTSIAKCKHCGERTEAVNCFESSPWSTWKGFDIGEKK